MKDKKYCQVRDHCHYTGEYRSATHTICNLKYSVPKKIPISIMLLFSQGIKLWLSFYQKRAENFFKKFTCLGENTKKT